VGESGSARHRTKASLTQQYVERKFSTGRKLQGGGCNFRPSEMPSVILPGYARHPEMERDIDKSGTARISDEKSIRSVVLNKKASGQSRIQI
jgi:hypothetical protein